MMDENIKCPLCKSDSKKIGTGKVAGARGTSEFNFHQCDFCKAVIGVTINAGSSMETGIIKPMPELNRSLELQELDNKHLKPFEETLDRIVAQE